MKIVFMGTPDFALEALRAIISSDKHEVIAVISQPSKPKGRGGQTSKPPVAECADIYGIPLYQPPNFNRADDEKAVIKSLEADVFVVAAFGQILSDEILNMPKYGCYNIHASLLPKYRGASPINQAILDGEKETGITIMKLDSGLDTGDILLQKSMPIRQVDTFLTLHDELANLGASSILEALSLIESGNVKLIPQDNDNATHTSKISKSLGRIDWSNDAQYLERLVRAVNPWPGAYTDFRGRILKIWHTESLEDSNEDYAYGTVISKDADSFSVKAGKGALRIYGVQPEGKRRMSAKEFMAGNSITLHEEF